jgi:hypothetical protein
MLDFAGANENATDIITAINPASIIFFFIYHYFKRSTTPKKSFDAVKNYWRKNGLVSDIQQTNYYAKRPILWKTIAH